MTPKADLVKKTLNGDSLISVSLVLSMLGLVWFAATTLNNVKRDISSIREDIEDMTRESEADFQDRWKASKDMLPWAYQLKLANPGLNVPHPRRTGEFLFLPMGGPKEKEDG
jgi:hypothetical protein